MVCRLVISEQQSLAEEKVMRNGAMKILHSVVKNTPFMFTLVLGEQALDDGTPVDFHSLLLEAKLVYDCEDRKEVQFVRSAPIEYTVNIDKTSPKRVFVEMQIKVLSSQHEDMFFKINFLAKDAKTGDYTSLAATSHPIRVVSKPNQLTKTKTKQTHKRSCPSAEEPTGDTKRLLDDTLIHLLQKLVEQQQESQRLILQLVQRTQVIEAHLSSNKKTIRIFGPPEEPPKSQKEENLLPGLLTQDTCDEPPMKVRKTAPASNNEILSEPASIWGSGDEANLLTEQIGNIEDFLHEQFLSTSGDFVNM